MNAPMSKKRVQCRHCPWRVGTDPNDIPNGYCSTKHANLKSTIARDPLSSLGGPLVMMACHEAPVGNELPCVGWLSNQLGPGNNLGLRLAAATGSINCDFELVGEQHPTLEDTLPR